MVCSLLGCVDCAAAQSAPQTGAEAFILMDAGSGRVLTGKNTEQELAIASTTKIMTALVALETGNLSDKVTVKQNHLKEGSSMYLRAGEVLTLEELLYGLLLPSGNDAAECIADHCSGGVELLLSGDGRGGAARIGQVAGGADRSAHGGAGGRRADRFHGRRGACAGAAGMRGDGRGGRKKAEPV